jgi:hypothetical protein
LGLWPASAWGLVGGQVGAFGYNNVSRECFRYGGDGVSARVRYRWEGCGSSRSSKRQTVVGGRLGSGRGGLMLVGSGSGWAAAGSAASGGVGVANAVRMVRVSLRLILNGGSRRKWAGASRIPAQFRSNVGGGALHPPQRQAQNCGVGKRRLRHSTKQASEFLGPFGALSRCRNSLGSLSEALKPFLTLGS